MVKTLAAKCVEVTADAVSHGDADAVKQFEDSEITVINLDNEHTPHRIHRNDCPCLHVPPFSNFSVVISQT